MPEQLVVIGASTPTIIRVIEDINRAGDRRIHLVGFVDSAHADLGRHFHGFDILGAFDAIRRFGRDEVVLVNTIAGSMELRVKTTEYFLSLGYRFTNVVHPGVNINHVTMGTGNLVYENALIHPFVEIGNHCVISSNAGIAHDTSVKDYCFVGPASYICGNVEIEDGVFIGTGARILPRLRIGKGAHIAACALVTGSVADGQRIKGVPGRAS